MIKNLISKTVFAHGLLSLALVASAAAQQGFPNTRLQTFACPPIFQPPGTVCYTGVASGQTLSDRPLLATVRAAMIVPQQTARTGTLEMIARMSVTRLADPTNLYDAFGTMPVLASARICSYLRGCFWRQVDTKFSMERTFGQRYFENGPTFDVRLSGNSGAEEVDMLTELDLWLPGQQYPIVVRF